ncbi:MAG: ATP synthase subunit I [Porticoccaceae bacterium]|nr:ATP synthase subunit I [Porticoccaceae bacterium]
MSTISTPPIYKVALYQIFILLAICGVVVWVDSLLASSILAGGLIQIGPQAWFAHQAYKYSGARQVDKIVRAMYWGESGKVVLTAALFITAFIVLKQLNFLAVFSTFIVMIPLQWFITVKILKH